MKSRLSIIKKAYVPEFPNTLEDENRKISIVCRECSKAEPIDQIRRDRFKMGGRIPKTSSEVRMDTQTKRAVQKEVLNILCTQSIKSTSTWALETTVL